MWLTLSYACELFSFRSHVPRLSFVNSTKQPTSRRSNWSEWWISRFENNCKQLMRFRISKILYELIVLATPRGINNNSVDKKTNTHADLLTLHPPSIEIHCFFSPYQCFPFLSTKKLPMLSWALIVRSSLVALAHNLSMASANVHGRLLLLLLLLSVHGITKFSLALRVTIPATVS